MVDIDVGPSSRPDKKRKDKHRRDDNLVAAAEWKAARPKNGPPKDHFEKLLEAPCNNHEGPVKHALKDCNLMKKFLAGTMKPRAPEAAKKNARGQEDEDDEAGYPREDGAVLMIFGGTPARPPKRQEKLSR